MSQAKGKGREVDLSTTPSSRLRSSEQDLASLSIDKTAEEKRKSLAEEKRKQATIDKRDSKRKHMRDSLKMAEDPFTGFEVPRRLTSLNKRLLENVELENRQKRNLSDLSINSAASSSKSVTEEFLERRDQLVQLHKKNLMLARSTLKDALAANKITKQDYAADMAELEEQDKLSVKERAVLARKRARLEVKLEDSTRTYVGDAYVAALTSMMDPPRDANLELVRGSRSKHEQLDFRERVLRYYDAQDPDDEDGFWCPISQRYVHKTDAVAAHIVPHAIGEENASYIFGLPRDQGWSVLWDKCNGMCLYRAVESALDHGEVVIVPWKDDEGNDVAGEYRAIVLGAKLLRRGEGQSGPNWKKINGRKLVWRNNNRPAARYLYCHFAYSLLRRQRYDVPGWFEDRVIVPKGTLWATPGSWLRRSTLKALAAEVGDMADAERYMEDIKGTFVAQGIPESLEEEAVKAVEIRDGFERNKDEDKDKDE